VKGTREGGTGDGMDVRRSPRSIIAWREGGRGREGREERD
jgi:hypothetical protein